MQSHIAGRTLPHVITKNGTTAGFVLVVEELYPGSLVFAEKAVDTARYDHTGVCSVQAVLPDVCLLCREWK